ncbi:Alpha/Beta hydrolase protein [Sporodiniella umbellata]|nr:Alpha/Beta hydrolase protein [Sporodiniella umbellata]
MGLIALFQAGVATLYIIQVAVVSLSIAFGYNVPQLVELSKHKTLEKYMMLTEVLASLTVELSLQIFVVKLVIIQLVQLLGGFNYTLSTVFYYVDIISLFGLIGHFYEMTQEREVTEAIIKLINKKNTKPLSSFLSVENAKRLVNPILRSSDIRIHPNITYGTNEEIKEALEASNHDFSQPRKLMLNVICKSSQTAEKRPVLFHIHGGGWITGNKDVFYAYQDLLVSEDNWVIVNIGYRLAPKFSYPAHLIDVKRAIRWTKQNIASFGGDPNFIVAIGDSAGGHLSAMAALTPNDPQYQPGFEDVDTSLRGVVSINGALDLTTEMNMSSHFAKQAMNLTEVNLEALHKHSPVSNLAKAEKLVPFLCLAGERDTLVTVRDTINFKNTYDQKNQGSCTLAISPKGRHVTYAFWSPRSFYYARVIQAWCKQLYENEQ